MYAASRATWEQIMKSSLPDKMVEVTTPTLAEPTITNDYIPEGRVFKFDFTKMWDTSYPSLIKWTIPVWCHRVDRWMSFALKDKDWSQHLVEWKELQLEQPEKGCKPVPPAGWEVPDDWNQQPVIRWESNRGHVIHGSIIKTSF